MKLTRAQEISLDNRALELNDLGFSRVEIVEILAIRELAILERAKANNFMAGV